MEPDIRHVKICDWYGDGLLLDNRKFRRAVVGGFNENHTAFHIIEVHFLNNYAELTGEWTATRTENLEGLNGEKLEQIALEEMQTSIKNRIHSKLYETLLKNAEQYEKQNEKTRKT